MRSRRFLLTLAALAPLSRGAAQPAPASSAGRAPQVRTALGTVAGLTLPDGVRSFRGLPYAAPPVRALRWRPPQPAARWSGVRAADRFADQCMQPRIFADMVFRASGTSEDCLYLNVWTPATSANAGLPVLVYFYGGGFVAGDGSEPRYDGARLAARGLVVVTVNYRLGVFGYLAHPALSRESPHGASGNYGLMDQTAALRWVREHVAAFGGDPRRVTIGGESAGAMSVSAQLASPLARGLVAGAIGESGAFFGPSLGAPTRAETERQGEAFARLLGAPDLAALRALSAHELMVAAMRPDAPRFGPNVDGHFLPESPAAIYAAGRQARVPLLAGWNSEEQSWRALQQEAPTPETFPALLARLFGARADEAAQAYPARTPDEAAQSATDLASDRWMGHPTWKWLEEHARTSGRPVWRYLYARPRPPEIAPATGPGGAGGASAASAAPTPTPARGAVHSAEIEYALGNLATNRVFAWTPEDHALSDLMQRYWANFVRTGDPNGDGLPPWPAGAVRADGTAQRLRLDATPRTEAEPRARYLILDRVSAPPAP